MVRVTTVNEQGEETDLQSAEPRELLGMVWQLTVDAWVFTGESIVEPRLQRHVVRIERGGS